MTTLEQSGRSAPTARRGAVARRITDLLAPVHLVVGNLLLIGAASHPRPLVGVGWGLLAALFAGLLPLAFLLYGIRRGRYTDRHVKVREQRRGPLLFSAVSVMLGIALLASLGAPEQLLALVVAMLVGLIVTLAVTHWWKISIHAAVAGGAGVILFLVFGPSLLLVVPIVAGVCWSRVALGDHTSAQVLGGVAVGGLVAATVFSALR